jgi:hypothetical protein
MRKLCYRLKRKLKLTFYSQNPAVLSQPQKVFLFVVQALEAETLQGQIANRVVASTRNLLQATGQDLAALLGQLESGLQQTVQAYFS